MLAHADGWWAVFETDGRTHYLPLVLWQERFDGDVVGLVRSNAKNALVPAPSFGNFVRYATEDERDWLQRRVLEEPWVRQKNQPDPKG